MQPAHRRFVVQVSLTVLVPVIVAGLAVLTLFVSSSIPLFQRDFLGNLHWVALMVGGVAFTSCSLLLYFILRPVRRFLASARKSGVIPDRSQDNADPRVQSDLEEYRLALEQVGLALSRLDAKALFPEIVAQSRAMRSILGQIMKVAPTATSVLLTGESGTGKELAARAVHSQSGRRDGPLVAINCAAIPEDLLESELFGHEKGAFTGAITRKLGKFELAHGGTLLLDEISEMDQGLQAKLLRVLQEGELDRVGGSETVPVDVRVLATTNRNLAASVEAKEFRQDLYYRLNVIPLRLPPLRERGEDIQLLADFFVGRFAKMYSLGEISISPEARQWLTEHDWPGNVRELQNLMERAALLCGGAPIESRHFLLDESGDWQEQAFGNDLGSFCAEEPRSEPSAKAEYEDDTEVEVEVGDAEAAVVDRSSDATTLDISDAQRPILPLHEVERQLIFKSLDHTAGNRTQAALLLGVSVRTLRNKLNEYRKMGLQVP